jgi:hypothetical protein
MSTKPEHRHRASLPVGETGFGGERFLGNRQRIRERLRGLGFTLCRLRLYEAVFAVITLNWSAAKSNARFALLPIARES